MHFLIDWKKSQSLRKWEILYSSLILVEFSGMCQQSCHVLPSSIRLSILYKSLMFFIVDMKSFLLNCITSDGCSLLILNGISLDCVKRNFKELIKESKYGKNIGTL